MNIKYICKISGLLLTACLIFSCQSINSSYGEFYGNKNREAMLTTVGYKDKCLFDNNDFVSFKNLETDEPFQIHVKEDRVKLSKHQQYAFNYQGAKIDSLAKHKKQVFILSLVNKQKLIEEINDQVDIRARPDLEIVTEILVKEQPGIVDVLNSDSKYFVFNDRQKSYEILFYKDGNEKKITLKPNHILGYKSLFLCCTNRFNKIKVKNISKNNCPGASFKTLKDDSKTENYEKL